MVHRLSLEAGLSRIEALNSRIAGKCSEVFPKKSVKDKLRMSHPNSSNLYGVATKTKSCCQHLPSSWRHIEVWPITYSCLRSYAQSQLLVGRINNFSGKVVWCGKMEHAAPESSCIETILFTLQTMRPWSLIKETESKWKHCKCDFWVSSERQSGNDRNFGNCSMFCALQGIHPTRST